MARGLSPLVQHTEQHANRLFIGIYIATAQWVISASVFTSWSLNSLPDDQVLPL
jgi:hypothetical protein